MNTKMSILSGLFLFLLVGCAQRPLTSVVDSSSEREKILAYLHEGDEFLIQQDIDKIRERATAEIAYNIIGGNVMSISREELQAKSNEELISEYSFDKIRYLSVEELSAPVINFSKDGSLAWVVVNNKYTFELPGNEEQKNAMNFNLAGLMVLEKINGDWTTTALAQTIK